MLGTSPLLRSLARGAAGHLDSASVFEHKPRIALIIDDLGYNQSRVLPFLDLGVPITFSILPHLMYSERLAEALTFI